MLNSLQNTKAPSATGAPSAGGDSHKSIAVAETQNPPKRKLLQPDSFNEVKLAEEFRESTKNCKAMFADPSFDLPMLPTSAVRVMNLIQDPNASPKKIAHALQTDTVLTAKFLRMANSPFYAGTRVIDSVHVAVDRLGMAVTKNLVLSISLNGTIVREKRLGHSAMGLWSHANNAALASQLLAQRLSMPQQAAFMMGLMHDIGKLAAWVTLNNILSKYPGVRPGVLEMLVEESHLAMGDALLTIWKMPLEVRVAAGAHHNIESLNTAMQYVLEVCPEVNVSDCSAVASTAACVMLADRALGALGLSDEELELDVTQLEVAEEIGLSQSLLMTYLSQLPKYLQDNTFQDK